MSADLAKRLDILLDPVRGIARGIIEQDEPGKGGKDADTKVIPTLAGELREAHAVLAALKAERQNRGEA